MLKVRVIPTLLYKDFALVKGIAFDSWRCVGSPMQAIKIYNMREVDELVFLDIYAGRSGAEPDYALIDDLADECFMPLAVGGGVRTLRAARRLLQVGADKIVFGAAAYDDPALIEATAQRFGTQCVVVSIDCRSAPDGAHEVYVDGGTRATGLAPVDFARAMEARGAGELLVQSIDRDGTLEGYDLPLIASVAQAVSIPVIASGGAATYDDFARAVIEAGASAVAASALFHFTEQTPLEAKRYMRERGIPARL